VPFHADEEDHVAERYLRLATGPLALRTIPRSLRFGLVPSPTSTSRSYPEEKGPGGGDRVELIGVTP
jgi:hypothetical protein